MAEPRQRTAEEREAARRERERRRGGGVIDNPSLDDARDEPVPEAPSPQPAAFDLDADSPWPPARTDTALHAVAAAEDGDPPAADPDRDPPAERPAGTRRVSRLGGGDGAPPPRPVRARRTRARPPRGPQRRHPWAGRIGSLIALVLAGGLIWFLVSLFQPFGTSPHGRVTVVIPAHSSAGQVGDLLERDGVISSSFFFQLRATLAGQRGDLRSGRYELAQGMSYGAVLDALTKAPPAAVTTSLTISEGRTRAYVSALLRRQGISGNYLAATRHSRLLDPRAYGAPAHVPSLEGFLFPDTFTLVEPVHVTALVDDQLRDFKQRFAGVSMAYARSRHLTPYDVLTIASLVQSEAATARDQPLIASVIYNRLADHMALQLDSTTRYATGNATGPLTVSELNSPSPYNTRVHTGLPPTPINSPGLAAIQAAAHPPHTRYLYFFAKPCSTSSVYATSYAQFLALLARDRRTHC